MADTTTTTGLDYVGRQTYLGWTTAVRARGGLATVFPSQTKLAGQPAERYPADVITSLKLGEPVVWTTGRKFGYYEAGKTTGAVTGAKVRAVAALQQATRAATIDAGHAAETAENIAKSLSFGSIVTAVAIALGLAFIVRGRSS
jgi:hypothetical protein